MKRPCLSFKSLMYILADEMDLVERERLKIPRREGR